MVTKQEDLKRDWQLETKFAPTIKQILGLFFFTKDMQADLKEGTDFAIFSSDPIRVGVRLRRYKYYKNPRYRQQFTIRWARPSGVDTEIHKIYAGLVSHILYGFVNEDESKMVKYFIGDLEVFRKANPMPLEFNKNLPRDSDFAVYNPNQFPNNFVLKSWEN